jgi:arginyl-tRNA synthetase
MILPIQHIVRRRMADAVLHLYNIPVDDPVVAAMPVDIPPRRAMGDLAVPLAFELARRLRKAPRAIAQEIVGALGQIEGFARIEATPNGYVNFFLGRPAQTRAWLTPPSSVGPPAAREKEIVEHTAINPNKAAHIGHLRNAALGDSFGRLLRFLGRQVEIQNYIDDTGVQVADVVVGFRELEKKSVEEVMALAETTRFDYYCWDLYSRVTEWYDADKTRLKIRAAALHDIEHGGNDTATLGAFIADRIVRCHLETMRRLNIGYDLLTWEGDIIRLHFWAHAFEFLKKTGAVYMQTEGRLEGCWVMRIDDGESESDKIDAAAGEGDRADESPAGEDAPSEPDAKETREKVIVRSDGTVTYVGKDMANQLWKFGLLGKDFYYRVFAERNGDRPLWSTTSRAEAAVQAAPAFGRAAWVCNVIDTRQSYLQKLVKQALDALGYHDQASHSVHYAYEVVVLSLATASELGYSIDESEGRNFVEVSGRRGLGVKIDDMLDRLIDKASLEVAKRNTEMAEAQVKETARAIAVAAIRYFMVKYSRGKVIVFDMDEALSFEGESGPYLQYAVVRANNIFNKLQERDGLSSGAVIAALPSTPADVLSADSDEARDLWGLILESARLDEIVEQAVRTLELSVLAKYAFGLAQSFNAFYHRYSILNEERQDARIWRAAAVAYFRAQLTTALELMGATVPAKM